MTDCGRNGTVIDRLRSKYLRNAALVVPRGPNGPALGLDCCLGSMMSSVSLSL
jgi:hypothetical protein